MLIRRLYRILFFISIIVVLTLSVLPQQIPGAEHIWDKAQHALAFFALTFLGFLAYEDNPYVIIFFLICHGVLIECIQFFIPYRTFSFFDMFSDVVGILVFLLVNYFFKKIKQI